MQGGGAEEGSGQTWYLLSNCGGQADSQAHVAVRKAHEAAALAIDNTYYPQEGVRKSYRTDTDHPRQINVMLTSTS